MTKIIITILLAAVKYAVTFPLVIYEFKFSFFETILWMNAGGILGVIFFGFLFKGLIRLWKRLFKIKVRNIKEEYKKKKNKKVFTKRNRRIVTIKQRYGLAGIVATTPVLLSIPIGVFLVVRYYKLTKVTFLYLAISIFIWSLIFTSFYMFWQDLFAK